MGRRKIVYLGIFLNEKQASILLEKIGGSDHVNKHTHHLTIAFGQDDVDEYIDVYELGSTISMHVSGYLSNDNLDVVTVDNVTSVNEHPHITVSTAKGVKPFQSNAELTQDQDNVIKDLVTVQISGRLALPTYLPNAGAFGNFATAIVNAGNS